jgi:DNA polymerase-3 subunit chi
MTEIDFYTHVEDKLLFACQLTRKVYGQKRPLVIYAADFAVASKIDNLLWSSPSIGFIPHCAAEHRLAPQTPVIIAREQHDFPHHDVLVNLHNEQPPFFSRFERVVEIVSTDEADQAAARERFRFYRDRGYVMRTHAMNAG